MKTIRSIKSMRQILNSAKRKGKTIAFVPTMGYLHDGHLSLVKAARKKCDLLVVSIFVNPIQFGPKEDLKKYPRDLEMDSSHLKKLGTDFLFLPDDKEMYGSFHKTYIDVTDLSSKLCGRSRPHHFKGVTTVVAKLLNIINPDFVYFGLKDFQQQEIIRQMVDDLNMPVKVISLPTIREKDGLAMSSRNSYLNKHERAASLVLFKSLKLAENLFKQGENNAVKIKNKMGDLIATEHLVKIDYISICNPKTFEEYSTVKSSAVVAIAVHVGKTRLIDNILL